MQNSPPNNGGNKTFSISPRTILHVAWYYAVFSSLWIIGSDFLIYLKGGDTLGGFLVSISKGLLFVIVTTILIHLYISWALHHTLNERDALQIRLHEWSRHANDIILLLDDQGRVLEANEKALSTYGYTEKEFVAKSLSDLTTNPAKLQLEWPKTLARGESRAQTVHRRADGSVFPVEYSSKRIKTSGGVLVQSILRDISESEAARQQIIRLKDIYAALSQTNHCIAQVSNQKELFESICEIAIRYGHLQMAAVILLNEQKRLLQPVASAGKATKYLDGLSIELSPVSPEKRGPICRAFSERAPVLSDQIPSSEHALWRSRMQQNNLEVCAAFPLLLRGEPVGALSLYSEIPGYFTHDLTNLLEEMARNISAALERLENEAEQKRLAAQLAESHAWIEGIVNESTDMITAVDCDLRLTLDNRAGRQLVSKLGITRNVGENLDDRIEALSAEWRKALAGFPAHKVWSFCEEGSERFIESRLAPLYNRERNLIGAFHIGRDITESKRMEMELRKLMTAIEQSPVTVVITDTKGIIQYVNPAFEATSGYTAAEAIGINPRVLKSGETSPEDYAALWKQLLKGESWTGVFHNKRKDGSLYWEDAILSPVRDSSGKITQFIAVKQDITLRREAEENAKFLAYYDPLTRLPNRLMGSKSMEQTIAEAKAASQKAALLFLDVDHFKRVNDSLGHEIGDRLLQALAERITKSLRTGDSLNRLTGDEFLIVMANVADDSVVRQMAELIQKLTIAPFLVDGFELTATLSIGGAIYPDDGLSFDELHRRAGLALYRAKDAGRNTYRMYAKTMDTAAHEYLLILNGLRKAIDRREFVLYYQPQISLKSGQVVGAEALIRWRHPELGLVPPGRFISVAEDSGLIVEIGEWVIRECCRQVQRWRNEGVGELVVAANVSALQFRRGHLDEIVKEALSQAGLEPRYLELELTESALAEDQINVASILRRLSALGVSLALDDFGTGYSTFAYLSHFKLDRLKIDQSFIRNITTNRNNESIVTSIVKLAQSFGLQTGAEGVESEQALSIVGRAGCDHAQGYLFAKPMVAEDFARFVARNLSYDSVSDIISAQNGPCESGSALRSEL